MTGRMYFLFGSTFFIGMLCGMYLFVTAFAPVYESGIDTGENISKDTLVIAGEMYGGCSETNSCASFRLINGREYNYLSSAQAERLNGNLSPKRRAEILGVLSADILSDASRRLQSDSCSVDYGGVDYAYTVWLDGETYDLDTCSTALAYDVVLQETLLDIWFAMENNENESQPLFEGNITDLLWNRFHSGAE